MAKKRAKKASKSTQSLAQKKKTSKRVTKKKSAVKHSRIKAPRAKDITNNILSAEKAGAKALELQDPHHWKPFIISVLIVFAVAFLGNSVTTKVVNSSWYESIKPSITPPNYVFPIVWNILFFLLATSMYLAWIHSKKRKKKIIAWEYGINLFLNFLWSLIFFGLKSPLYAFIVLIFLWVSIFSMMYVTWDINRKASYFLLPYLLWVSFAGVLNFLIII